MTENDNEFVDSQIDTEEETVNTQDEAIEVEVDETNTEEVPDEDEKAKLEKQIATLQAQKEHWRKKATEKKDVATTSKDEPKIELSTVEIIALAKADLDPEDADEVLEYARFKKIPVTEALKSTAVKAVIAEKKEQKAIANATNTSSQRRGTARVSEERLLENARKGIMPDNDADLERLIEAQRGSRK